MHFKSCFFYLNIWKIFDFFASTVGKFLILDRSINLFLYGPGHWGHECGGSDFDADSIQIGFYVMLEVFYFQPFSLNNNCLSFGILEKLMSELSSATFKIYVPITIEVSVIFHIFNNWWAS